jgi:RNA polymerase sigma-70 factor (ECF subfamily)
VEYYGIDVATSQVDDQTRRLRLGDESALSAVYSTHGPSVRSYVSRFVPAGDVDDVVQQTFIEVWRARERIDVTRPLVAFILGVARKRSIDLLRKRRHDVVDVSQVRELVGRDGDELLNQMVWASEVQRGLAGLPEEQRTVIVLAYFEDLTQTEIARRLEIPLGTVKARMARGLARLAERIEQEELML